MRHVALVLLAISSCSPAQETALEKTEFGAKVEKAALDRLKALIPSPERVRERLRPMVVATYRLEPPPPAAQLSLGSPMLDSLKELALLVSEGPAVLYHTISIPRIR